MPEVVAVMGSREGVELFCRKFFGGHYSYLQRIVGEYEDRYTSIDVQQLLPVNKDFDMEFQRICDTVLSHRERLNKTFCDGHVIAILGFAQYTDRQLKGCSWYNRDVMVSSLTDVLLRVKFKPYKLVCTAEPTCILL